MGQTRAFGTQKKRSQAPQKRKLAQGDRPWAQHSFAILFTALGWLLAKISVIPLKKERERGKRREGGRERKRETERERYTLFSLICTIKSELTCGFALRSQGHQMMLVSWASRNVRRADMPTEIRGHVRWHPGRLAGLGGCRLGRPAWGWVAHLARRSNHRSFFQSWPLQKNVGFMRQRYLDYF